MLTFIENWFFGLVHGDQILMYIETYYSGLADVNRVLLIILLSVVLIIGLFQIFKKILKITSGIAKFVVFAIVLYYLATVFFNI